MIKAIVFDCFGVLTTDGWLPFKRKYFSHDAKLAAEATDLNKKTDAGLASYEDFARGIAALAHAPYEEAKKAIETNVTDDELLNYIATALKPHYKIGMLSNAGANWLDRLFSEEQQRIFDAVALSYETGFVKPADGAYHIIAERLGVDVTECVLIDDQERYCTAAREQGMSAVWYKSLEQLKIDLSPLLKKA